jgi:ankyrin repeat protein
MSAEDLLTAASSGNIQQLQQLLGSRTSIATATAAGWTALHAAAMAGQLEVMQLLMKGAGRCGCQQYPWLHPTPFSKPHGAAPSLLLEQQEML